MHRTRVQQKRLSAQRMQHLEFLAEIRRMDELQKRHLALAETRGFDGEQLSDEFAGVTHKKRLL